MKKKLLITSMFIILAIVLSLISYTHFSKNSIKSINRNKAVEDEKRVHNFDEQVSSNSNNDVLEEKKASYEQGLEKTEEKKENYTHNSSKETKTENKQNTTSNNINQNNNSSNTNTPNNPNSSNNTSSQNTSIETSNNETVNQDEKIWEEFKKEPFVLMALESNSIDWENKNEQEAEANRWIDLGYRVEMPYQCINLSSGNRCVYGLIVYLPKGICGETPNEIKVDWRKRNYVGIVTYAKSLGYKCEGYQD